MPWSNQGGGGPWGGGGSGGGGGGGGPSPWGRGGGGMQPPNLEDLLRRGQDKFRSAMPGSFGTGKGVALLAIVGIALWLATGFYRVQPDEQGVVMRFGQWVRTAPPGLNYHLPPPIERVETPKVTRDNRIEVGFRSAAEQSSRSVVAQRGAARSELAEESLMLTGDENIVDIKFVVFWRIKDAGQFLFNVRLPEMTVKQAVESVMREIIGQTPIQRAFTEGRATIEIRSQEQLQKLLDEYKAGIYIRQVQLLEVDPPAPVVDAFNEVQRATADRERLRNEAEAYRNEIVPRARGEAERIVQEARAYKEEVTNRAQGDANRFNSVLSAYKEAKDVTTTRIYIETMEQVLRSAQKVLMDRGADGGSGVVPYLPLPEIAKRAARPPEAPKQ